MSKTRTFEVFWSDEDQIYFGICHDHPGLVQFGYTEEEAFHKTVDVALAIDRIKEQDK